MKKSKKNKKNNLLDGLAEELGEKINADSVTITAGDYKKTIHINKGLVNESSKNKN